MEKSSDDYEQMIQTLTYLIGQYYDLNTKLLKQNEELWAENISIKDELNQMILSTYNRQGESYVTNWGQ